ncbi:MAG: response regulator [Flavobacteriales bacterium]|nr:response regulator [Flavobacteriales bacterium]
MTIDANGSMWIGTGQLWRFDTRTLRMTMVRPRDPNLNGILDNVISTYQDRNGLVWVGSAGYGVLAYDPRVERFNTQPGASVRWLQPTIDGDVLSLSQRKFLSVFDPATRTFIAESVDQGAELKKLFDGLIDDTEAVTQDEDGLLWLCKGDLFSLDLKTGNAQRFPLADETGRLVPHRKSCFPIHQDGNKALWFGCDTAFYRFDKSSHRFSRFRFPVVPVQYPYLFVQAIHQDAQGIFWIGTVKGLLRLDPSTGAWKHYANDPDDPTSLSFDLIFSILADPTEPDRYLWIGTNGGGLNRFDKRTGTCTRLTEKDGLPNDVVYGILSDADGDLWMSTNKGISHYSPSSNTFRNFTASDGLQSDEFNRNAFCKLKDGRLFFGGVNGFNHFHPDELREDARPVDVRITDIKLMNRSIAFEEDNAALQAPSYLSEGMRIPYSANMVTFSFASMEFSAPEEHRYQYKLEGFDPDWIMSGTDNSAIYTNLDPGTYTFRVRGDNRDGIWDEQGTSFNLVVLPPWWKTWWAYLSYVLVIAGSIVLFISLRTAGLKRQKELLEQTVAVRTAELSHAKERAEKSELIKQQFLANMSHEIRTPMNAIMGMTGILRRNEHPPEQDKYLDAIAQSSDNLLVVINDILDLSKMEAGKIILESVPFDTHELVAHIRDLLHFKAEEKGLQLNLDIDPDVPRRLIGDPTRLQQVLLNLVGNGIKFTEEGEVRISVGASDLTATHCMLRIMVSDTGVGIPQDRLDRVFEEFTQAYSDTTRKYGGTGLGLSISKRLVEMQGGTLTAISEKDKGSNFMVSIPFSIAATIEKQISGTADEVMLRGLRILLAEDNEFNAMVAQDELEDAIPGVRVDRAENGTIAVQMAGSGDYDVILMDVQMPEMNGYDATRAIRALPDDRSRVPIVAMTANVMEAELKLCREAGMIGHIPKPFSREELLNAIHAVRVMDPPST